MGFFDFLRGNSTTTSPSEIMNWAQEHWENDARIGGVVEDLTLSLNLTFFTESTVTLLEGAKSKELYDVDVFKKKVQEKKDYRQVPFDVDSLFHFFIWYFNRMPKARDTKLFVHDGKLKLKLK